MMLNEPFIECITPFNKFTIGKDCGWTEKSLHQLGLLLGFQGIPIAPAGVGFLPSTVWLPNCAYSICACIWVCLRIGYPKNPLVSTA